MNLRSNKFMNASQPLYNMITYNMGLILARFNLDTNLAFSDPILIQLKAYTDVALNIVIERL